MKTLSGILRFFLSLLAIMVCIGTSAQADLIGLTPSFPDLLANTQGDYAYDMSDQAFTFSATPLKLSYSSNDEDYDYIYQSSSQGHDYTATIAVDNEGNFIENGINTLTVAGRINNDDGILLTGTITDFGWSDPIPVWQNQFQIFDFTYQVTGGLLADFFGGIGTIMGAIAFSEDSEFGSNGWDEDFEGSFTKIDNFPLPLPGAVWLVLTGLGVAGLHRKIRKS